MASLREMLRKVRSENPEKAFQLVLPLYGRILSMQLPAPFEPAYQAQNQNQFIQEYVPQGENLEDWSEMITIMSFKGIGRSPKTTEEIARLLGMSGKGCKQGWAAELLENKRISDDLELAVTFGSCNAILPTAYPGASDKKSEQTVGYLFRDNQNLYIVQYARRDSNDGSPALPLNVENALTATPDFKKINLCRSDSPVEKCKEALTIDHLRRNLSTK